LKGGGGWSEHLPILWATRSAWLRSCAVWVGLREALGAPLLVAVKAPVCPLALVRVRVRVWG